VELVERRTLAAAAIAVPERAVDCDARLDAPGVPPDDLVLTNKIRAMSAYKKHVRNSGIA